MKRMASAGSSVWALLPADWQERTPIRTVGASIHTLSRTFSDRSQSYSTWFLRNRPLLLALLDLANRNFCSSELLRLCAVGCSTGAELYSVTWMIRTAFPDLKISGKGIDISAQALERARCGRYQRQDAELRGPLPDELLSEIFDVNGDELKIKDSIASGIEWILGDASSPEIRNLAGLQDIVLANNLLVHMKQPDAAACLRNLVSLLAPGGYFVCRGVDLSIRERAVKELGLRPVMTLIEEIHNADLALDARRDWPWKYWGLEPLDKSRKDWAARYATIFQTPGTPKNHTRARFDQRELFT